MVMTVFETRPASGRRVVKNCIKITRIVNWKMVYHMRLPEQMVCEKYNWRRKHNECYLHVIQILNCRVEENCVSKINGHIVLQSFNIFN